MQSAEHHLAALRPLLETALDAVVVMDASGAVADWSPSAEQMFGWRRDEAVGREMAGLIIPEELREAHRRGLARFLATGEAAVMNQRLSLSALTRDRGEIPVELSITTWSDAGRTVFVGFVRDVSEQRLAEARQKLLMEEINHRVKNTLSIVMAMALQTGKSSIGVKEFNAAFQHRLKALARSHELLTRERWEGADVAEVAASALEPHAQPGSARLALEGPAIRLGPAAAVNLSLVLHELATNCAKYGAWSIPEGRVTVSWEAVADAPEPRLRLVWIEIGGPETGRPTRRGFGSQMIERVAKSAALDFGPDGLRAEIVLGC